MGENGSAKHLNTVTGGILVEQVERSSCHLHSQTCQENNPFLFHPPLTFFPRSDLPLQHVTTGGTVPSPFPTLASTTLPLDLQRIGRGYVPMLASQPSTLSGENERDARQSFPPERDATWRCLALAVVLVAD